MFTFETYVGPKYGSWLRSNMRTNHPEAAIRDLKQAERKATATAMFRRVVRV